LYRALSEDKKKTKGKLARGESRESISVVSKELLMQSRCCNLNRDYRWAKKRGKTMAEAGKCIFSASRKALGFAEEKDGDLENPGGTE